MEPLYVSPMLAHTKPADATFLENDRYWAQEKLDGERRLFFVDSPSFHMTGRKLLKNGDVSDVIDKVPHLKEHPISKFSGSVFDGELMHPHGFQSLAKVMRSSTDKALRLQFENGNLVYHIYDILCYKGESIRHLSYANRYDILTSIFTHLPSTPDTPVKLVPSFRTSKEKQQLYKQIYEDPSKEGIMFRHHMGLYEEGKRSHYLLRLKKELTEDVFITGFLPSVREYTGKKLDSWTYWEHSKTLERKQGTRPSDEWSAVTRNYFYDLPGAFSFAQYDADGNIHELGNCSGFDREVAEDMKHNPDNWLDQVVEIKANERFVSNHFRHPRFLRRRDDKSKEQCIFENSDKE